ncbi:MAG: hemolysin family protein [Oscillospiraceae bacterium]|nr:hemolysin family protein [Oscillospiraceae bacterium]MDD4368406.1 hemolysin family protein [Oscillospiraceae bacterium]
MDGVSWLSYLTLSALSSGLQTSGVSPLAGLAQVKFGSGQLSLTQQGGSASSLVVDILIVLLLILVNGFFSGTEMAVVSLNDNKVRKDAQDGDKLAVKLAHFVNNPGNFLSTIQVGVTFAGFLSSAFAGDRFASRLYAMADPAGLHPWLKTLFLILITLFISYLSLVFGELVPKQMGIHNPEGFSKSAVGPVSAFGKVIYPFTTLLNASTNGVLHLLGIDPNLSDKNVTEEEIRIMVDVSRDSGNIQPNESAMIQNVFEFNDKEVSEIMTHRVNVSAIDINTTFDEVVALASEEGYTRLPVYEENIDNVIGILNVKDLLFFIAKHPREAFQLRDILRDPYFTPETKHVDSLFREMQRDHVAMAVVIDEYGGVSGIITLEDLLEEIVGNIEDEYDDESTEVVRNADGSYTIDGLTELDHLHDYIPEVHFGDDDMDYDTVAGLVLHQLDRIPDGSEHPEVVYGRYKFKVLEMDDRRIAKVLLTLLPPARADTAGPDRSTGVITDKPQAKSATAEHDT